MSTLKTNRIENLTTTDGGISIDNNGNVGIGTTTARAGLTVALGSGSIPAAGLHTGSAVFSNATDGAVYGVVVGANTSGIGYIQSQRTDGTATTYDLAMQPNGGNVGVGVTNPTDTANYGRALDISGSNGSALYCRNNGSATNTAVFGYYGTDLYIQNRASSAGTLRFYNAGTERMRLDSSGKVGIGTTTLTALLNVYGTESATLYQNTNTGSGASNGAFVGNWGTSDLYLWNYENNQILLGTSNTERARIDANGYFLSSCTTAYYGLGNNFHSFDQGGSVVQWTLGLRNSHVSNPYGMVISYSGATPNGTSNQFLYCVDTTGLKLSVKSNGGIENFQSNNSNLCDEREKKNIETLDSTWGCLKNWELKKFHYNQDADTDDKRYGVIAQQVEQHCPELITDWTKQRAEEAVLDEDGNVVTPAKEEILRKGVKEQQMMWMAIKTLQEAQTRIETLETQNADLTARITALETA